MSNEQLMWMSIGIWLLLLLAFAVAIFTKKPTALPSGGTAVTP